MILDEYRRDLHAWLLGSISSNELYEIFSERKIEGTCDWVLEQPWFLDWTSPDFPTGCAKILWINGHAGFGKSVICARVIDHVSSNSKDPVAHFFFSSDFESRRDPFIAIRSWLSQLLRHPVVFSLARERLATQQGQRATRGDTLKLLRELVIKIPRCTFVLDGLDECRWVEQDYNSNHGASIVDFLEALRQAIAGTSTRLLVVSRDEPEIRACLVNESNTNDAIVIQHSITPEDVRPDLDMFARSIVNKKLSTMTEGTKEDISQKLAECCNGQFLWVQMQESQLRDWKSPKQLEKAINSTPPGLDKTYDREWMGISHLSEDNRERAIALLRWAAFALRPLSVCEMAGALLINADCYEVRFEGAPGRINENYIKTEMMELCGSLIDIRSPEAECDPGSRTVQLAHFTVKEYLLCNLPVQGRLLQLNSSLKFSTEGMENTLAAKMCLCYVDCEEVWQETSEEGRAQVLGPFRDYAARSWYQHASFGNIRDSELVKSVNQLFDTENPNWASWKEWFDLNDVSQKIGCFDNEEDLDPSTSDDEQEIGSSNSADDPDLSTSKDGQTTQTTSMSPLYYTTWLGMIDTMDLLLQSKECPIDEQGNFGRTPLSAACERGHIDAVKKLLDNDADLEIAGDNEHTALHTAACNGHAEIVKLLLEKGAKIHNGSNGSKTPLYCACLNGHHQVAQMLLQWEPDMITTHEGWIPLVAASEGGFLDLARLLIHNGADIDAPDSLGRTPLYVACGEGHIEIVRLLLDKGADVHHPNRFGWTPLNNASDEGFLDIVLLLIDRGADINVPNQDRETPLSNACYEGHIEVVHLLLDKGADIHRCDQYGLTPVNIASMKGFPNIVLLLIERGADISVPDENGDTSLYNACSEGHTEVVCLLLDRGADINQDTNGLTPLLVASYGGHTKVVKMLLERGANLRFANKEGWTSIHIACWKGWLDVTAALLENGAPIEAANARGVRPLYLASLKGSLDVANLLLEKGANIHSGTKRGSTPLHGASREGSLDVTSLLLERGAPIDCMDFKGRTPLYLAGWNGCLEVANLLLKKGASIDTPDLHGRTPLHWASYKGFLKVANLLLENGANIARVEKGGLTPLHAASIGGSIEVVTLLIEKGAVIKSVVKGGVTPLHLASLNDDTLDIINLLLDKGADIESVDALLGTPLHTASVSGNLDVVNLLLERGAATEDGNFDDRTLLRYASPHGQLEVINNFFYSEKLRIDIRFERGCTPIFYVVARGPIKVVKLLLPRLTANSKDQYSVMRLSAAARNGYEEAIEQLITLARLQSNLGGFGRDLIWWVIGIGRSEILHLIHQWYYTQSFGARTPQASNDKLWSLVNLDFGRICDACTRPMLINTSYRRCEGCNNFNICLECVGFKVKCLGTVHEWSPCGPDGLEEGWEE